MLSSALRCLSIDMVDAANSGHPGLPLGMADVVTVLFRDFLHFDAKNQNHPLRDRFILSAGHGSALLYSLLYLTGYEKPTLEDIKNFRQLRSCAAGHPEHDLIKGIETTTGPLGQGLATAVGISLSQKLRNDPYFVYVLVSDGDLMEGISHEAISFAGHHQLSSLVVLWDNNDITIDGSLSLSSSDDQLKRFEACGWHVQCVDGHNEHEIHQALSISSKKPRLIACKTIIGKGSLKEGTSSCHGSPLGKEGSEHVKQKLGYPIEPFSIPKEVQEQWKKVGENGAGRLASRGKVVQSLDQVDVSSVFNSVKKTFEVKKEATRQTSFRVLEKIASSIPNLIGGSADLTPSNNTKTSECLYIHYGIREHAMSAIMNGLALSDWRPYGGTFLVFSDYLRPALRLSALMKLPVIYVLTHDSIGVGEDGPTHQPIEHLASLRAIPNLCVFRPADGFEVLESWQTALELKETPSVIVLTRQALNVHRTISPIENMTKRGAYIFKEASLCDPKITLLATGSEVDLSMQAQKILEEKGIPTRVVSMVCWRLFDQQPVEYQKAVFGNAPRIAIEAACDLGWHKYIGDQGIFLGLSSFGASGKAEDLFEHFGLTVENIVEKALALLKTKS